MISKLCFDHGRILIGRPHRAIEKNIKPLVGAYPAPRPARHRLGDGPLVVYQTELLLLVWYGSSV